MPDRFSALNYLDRLEPVLAEIISRWGIPGLGVGIVHGDEMVYSRYFGVQSLETGAPVRADTIFCVASISKCFVASAVMQLVEAGKLDLDAPLVQYLPYFKLNDERCSRITPRQMLSHTSGMPDMDESEYDALVYHPETDEGALERYVRGLQDRKMIGEPSHRFAYSNIAYNVLGHLIAKVSGQTFEAYMQDHILRPAGMADSTFLLAEVNRQRLAVPHLRAPGMIANPLYPYHRADAPASFLHGTLADFCHWAITCLKRGAYNGQCILNPASYDLMWTPVVEWGYPPFYESCGLGWTLGHFEGQKTASHGGMGFGWSDFLLLLPEARRAAVILGIEESPARDRLVEAVARALIGLEPKAGSVSWMIPVQHALESGGLQAARDRYAGLAQSGSAAYSFEEDDLISLVYQLMSVGKTDLAAGVLELNLQAFPESGETRRMLEKLGQ